MTENFENNPSEPLEFTSTHFTLINQAIGSTPEGMPNREQVLEAIENIPELANLTEQEKQHFADAFMEKQAEIELEADREAGEPEH